MDRRRFLEIVGLAGLASLIGVTMAAPSFEEAVYHVIQNHYPGLNIRKEEIDQFIHDADQTDLWKWLHIDRKQKLVLIAFTLLDNPAYLPYSRLYHQLVLRITESFIIATDFFRNGMNIRQPVHYVGLYNPFAMPCANPFSALYYDV